MNEEQRQTTVKSLIKEYELNDLMGKIIDHCFSRWNEKDLLIANRIKQFVDDFLQRKLHQALSTQLEEIIAMVESEIEKTWDVDDYNAVAGAGARRKLNDLLKQLQQMKK